MGTFCKYTLEIEQNWWVNRDLQAGFGDERQAPDLGEYDTTARAKVIASLPRPEQTAPHPPPSTQPGTVTDTGDTQISERAATEHNRALVDVPLTGLVLIDIIVARPVLWYRGYARLMYVQTLAQLTVLVVSRRQPVLCLAKLAIVLKEGKVEAVSSFDELLLTHRQENRN